jgi:hypothetical protein
MIHNSNRFWDRQILKNRQHGGNRQLQNVNPLLHLDKTYFLGETARQIMSVNRLTAKTIDVKERLVGRHVPVKLNAILGWLACLEIDFLMRHSVTNLRNLESSVIQMRSALMKQCVGIPVEIVSIRIGRKNACSNTVYQ